MQPAFLLNTLSAALALALASTGMGAESAEELIQKGDVFYDKLQAAEALKFYLPAEKLDPNNVRLLVRIARQYRHLMSDATKASEKQQLGNTAVDYAQRAVALAPNDPETQLALAISYGKMLPLEETKQQIATSRLIKIAADKVIALDPNNDLAWQVLGRWYLGLADIGGREARPGAGCLWQAAARKIRGRGALLREGHRAQSQSPHALHRARSHLRENGQRCGRAKVHHQGARDARDGERRSGNQESRTADSQEAPLTLSGSSARFASM